MLKLIITLDDYEPWSGAIPTWERLQEEDKVEHLEHVLEDLYPEGLTKTEFNDLLWFEPETVFEWVGLSTDEPEEDEEPEEDDTAFKDNIAKRFAEVYPGKRLLAVQLNGFSHSLYYDDGTSESSIQQDDMSGWTDIPGGEKASQVLGLIGHAPYQNNAVEYVYVMPEDR